MDLSIARSRCRMLVGGILLGLLIGSSAMAEMPTSPESLDAPLLFVKRHSYQGIHIYDTFFKWIPGGGIYLIENPSDPPEQHRIRPLIDPTTTDSLGPGIYSDPELSRDATRLLFCFKGTAHGSTGIFEIRLDGSGLRRLTDPSSHTVDYHGSHAGVHDVSPEYLPDGRIVFTSTRQHGLVPCANGGVDILHVMDADGSNIKTLSVNNVNEFDPTVLPDGRILHGRWEYVDKTALTQQSLWTIFPDGTNETALFANNLVRPEALLDARPVPDSPHQIVSTFARHNAPPRGSIAMFDTRLGKNSPDAIYNFDHPNDPINDLGNSCDPWPLSKDRVLYSGRPGGSKFNVIMMVDRDGNRQVVHAEPNICCHSPMLVKPRPEPRTLPVESRPTERTGRFFVQDIYRGLKGVERGEVKQLRVIEETSRVSATPGGAFNQTFLVSAALAFSVKNFLGIVPVESDGSAYFEVPSGRAIYLQALDADGRLVQSMRTFVQAAPGVTRSCIGCHEHKYQTPRTATIQQALLHPPHKLQSESWGSGFLDYPSMVQPVLDANCVRCHGGKEGIEGGMDLSGGWTEYFNISYENLATRRDTQLTAYWIAGIDCMNGTARWSAQIFPPRSHGSGAAPLAKLLVDGHDGHLDDMSRADRDLLMAWIDTNGVYHGTWDYSKAGCRVPAWADTRNALVAEMNQAGCIRCHGTNGKVSLFESDWINLERPERSRILRAPLAESEQGGGLARCRERKIDPRQKRINFLINGGYVHHVLPLESFAPKPPVEPQTEGEPVVSFASTGDPHYRAMLTILDRGRRQALASPRIDMPGAEAVAGRCRQFLPTEIPENLPTLRSHVDHQGTVRLSWDRSMETIGLKAEVHRGTHPAFTPGQDTLITTTTLFDHVDRESPEGTNHYALVLVSKSDRSRPIRAEVDVPPLPPPPVPIDLKSSSAPGRIDLSWRSKNSDTYRYHVYRAEPNSDQFARLTTEPTLEFRHTDLNLPADVTYAYTVRAVNRRGGESDPTQSVRAAALAEIKEPVFVASFRENTNATLHQTGNVVGTPHGKARIEDGSLDLREGGHVTFAHQSHFDLTQRLTLELRVHFDKEAQMPVVVSSGHWQKAGWFLQRIGTGWRWHVGGIDCDGGVPVTGRPTHLVGTFDGRVVRLYQDGKRVAEQTGTPNRTIWRGPLYVGQYSGIPSSPYQVLGRITGLKIYHRILSDKEIASGTGSH